MIKYKYKEGEGIQLLSKRFQCTLNKNDMAFIRRRSGVYRKRMDIALIASLIISIGLLQLSKRFQRNIKVNQSKTIEFHVEDVPVTKLERPTAAPSRPTVPIASEDEDLPEDETIDFTNLDFDEIPPPPPPPPSIDDDIPIFVPFDIAPEPVGGYAAIMRNLVYPEIGRRANVEGKVILHVKIDKAGQIGKIIIAQSLMENFDTAAMDAVRSVKWIPAKQRDIPVTVWLMVPITFKLTDGTD